MSDTPPDYEKLRERRQRLEGLDRQLADLLPSDDQWSKLNERARSTWIRKAHLLMRDQMGIAHETRIRLVHRGYEETTGEIHVPSWELDNLRCVVSLLGHELQHAWQQDVMLGRAEGPGGETERDTFEAAYSVYDPSDTSDPANYVDNPLEVDARYRAEEVLDGYKELRPATAS